MDPDSILDFSTVLSVFYSIEIGYLSYKIDMSTCQSVQADSCVLYSLEIGYFAYKIDMSTYHFVPLLIVFSYISFALFQQLTGEHKQMAKAMAKATKAASKAPAFKKRSASSSAAPLPKRRSYNQQDKGIVSVLF